MSNKMLLPQLLDKNDIEVLNLGHYTLVDSEGYLVNPSNLAKLPNKWKSALEEMKRSYLEGAPDYIHSIYVRGSVARGEPIEHVSDIDTVAVTMGTTANLDNSWINPKVVQLEDKYPFSTGFEFVHWNIENLEDKNNPKAVNLRFTMKTQFECIFGEDLLPSFPKVKPSAEMAWLQTANFEKSLKSGLKKLEERIDSASIGKASVWLSKRILRAGFFLVMDLEKKLTKDLYPSWESFSKYYPSKSNEMYTVLYLALNPKDNKKVLISFYETFGGWLLSEINSKSNL